MPLLPQRTLIGPIMRPTKMHSLEPGKMDVHDIVILWSCDFSCVARSKLAHFYLFWHPQTTTFPGMKRGLTCHHFDSDDEIFLFYITQNCSPKTCQIALTSIKIFGFLCPNKRCSHDTWRSICMGRSGLCHASVSSLSQSWQRISQQLQLSDVSQQLPWETPTRRPEANTLSLQFIYPDTSMWRT